MNAHIASDGPRDQDDSANGVDGPPHVPLEFHVHDSPSANWVVRKIVEARSYARRVEEWAASEIRRAERDERFLMERFGRELEQWASDKIANERSRKSLALPAGKVGFRTCRSKLHVQDERALIAWCKTNLPHAVATVEHVLKTPVNEHVDATGELPDGVEAIGGGENFFIR